LNTRKKKKKEKVALIWHLQCMFGKKLGTAEETNGSKGLSLT